MQRKPRLSVDPVVVIGTVLSVGLATAFYFYDELALTIATFAGLLGIILTLQVQAMAKGRRQAEHESRMGTIIAMMEQSPWLSDVVEPILRSATTVHERYPGTPAVDASQQALEECRNRLADLESGRFQYPYRDNALALRLCETVRWEFLAVSVSGIDLEWWLSPEGRRYWKLQEQALRRGVAIRRVFIHEGWSGELDTLAREQQDAGAQVLRVHRSQLPTGTRARGIVGIWDRSCGLEVTYDAAGVAEFFSYTVASPDLDRLRRQHELVERMAVGIDDPEPTAGVSPPGQPR